MRPRSLLTPLSGDALRSQELVLAPLNLALLAGVALFHALFAPALGNPPPILYALVLTRFAAQAFELAWLHSSAIAERTMRRYAHATIWLNLAFAFVLSRVSGVADSHYVVLMLLPVVAAAFRYRPLGIALAVGAAASATLLQVRLYFSGTGRAADATEYFEASQVALIYVAMAIVVALLARRLRAEQNDLRRSLEELERTRDALVEREKLAATGRLASAIAHEIRNPVAMIASSLELARRDGPGALSRADLDAILVQEARRLERLTNDFLAYARQRPPERRPTALAPTLGAAADLARARAADSRVAIAVDCPEDLVAEVDTYLLQQGVLNLVGNALDAVAPGGSVRLEATAVGPDVTLSVSNTGPPIPPAVVARLFEPFFSTKPGGTGLGLAITRSIARAHGGEIELAENRSDRVRFAWSLPGARSLAGRQEALCRAS